MTEAPFTIFHVDGEREFRGGERQLLYQASALRVRGHANVICCRRGGELSRESERQGFETLFLPFLLEFDPVSAIRLARAATTRGRPIVQAHTGHAAGVALLMRWLGGPPTVAHRRVTFPLRRLSRFKYSRMDHLVAISNAVAVILREAGLPADRIAVIHDVLPASALEWRWVGVETASFAPVNATRRDAARATLARSFGLDPGRAWIGNLAALSREKDHRTLIAAVPIVARTHPQAVFLIGGQGPEEGPLREMIRDLRLGDRVVLVGQQTNPGRFLAALDLFVLASRDEGMGSVLLEAGACGIPVVATAVGGVPEIVRHRETGLLAPPGDPGALARCIVELLDDRVFAATLSASALNALPRFGLAQAALRFEQLYQSLAPQLPSQRPGSE